MKTELENTELRKVIDKAYDFGYNEAVLKAAEWLEKYANNYVCYYGMSDEFIDDFINELKK